MMMFSVRIELFYTACSENINNMQTRYPRSKMRRGTVKCKGKAEQFFYPRKVHFLLCRKLFVLHKNKN